jgi:hypothetical protein
MSTDLYGRGGFRSLRTADWRACLDLAALFGWEPGQKLESDCQELCSYSVSDEDGRTLALALYKGIRELENGLEQSPEIRECLREIGGLELARSLADYAITGGFAVE